MNKATLIAKMAEKSELSKKQAEAALNAFTDTITEALKAGDKVQLMGFGTFEVKEFHWRDHRDPRQEDPRLQGWQGLQGSVLIRTTISDRALPFRGALL